MWIFARNGPSGFSACSTAEQVTKGVDGTGLTAIVTGATSGIGTETARVLALRGVHVIMAIRNVEAGNKLKETLLSDMPNAKIDVMELDVSSLASVRKFASEYNSSGLPLNILVNNAGVFATPYTLSEDNIELQFATNHIGHFLLTDLLLETMKNTARKSKRQGRIVIVSSELHNSSYSEGIIFNEINDKKRYKPFAAYGQSKLANLLHANELARRLQAEGVNITVNSLHPGVIVTNIARHAGIMGSIFNFVGKFVLKSIPQGAATQCYLALNPQVENVTGEYFADCNVSKMSSQANDPELAKKLWDFSVNLIASK